MLDHLTDEEFLSEFENCAFTRQCWTHQAHFRMAWLYLTRNPFGIATNKIVSGIKRFNASLNNQTDYHETITQAYCRIIHHRIRMGASELSYKEFARQHQDLFQ